MDLDFDLLIILYNDICCWLVYNLYKCLLNICIFIVF